MASSVGNPGSKLKKKHFKPKQQNRSKVFRASEPLLSVLMWGMNHAMNELSQVSVPVMLMPEDFKAYAKIKVDNHGVFNRESMPTKFRVKEYCPLVFRNLRERFGVDDQHFVDSITKSQPLPMGESSGRSGARFYRSSNSFLILKTLQSEEVEQMHSLIKSYHPYVVERHGKTLLPQYLAMYRLTVEGTVTYMVVMRNIFSSSLPIHTKYDLKGSTVDRDASEKEREKELPTYKDNDFVKDAVRLYLPAEEKRRIMEILEADTTFLAKMNLMDYSLCLGIHEAERFEADRIEREASGHRPLGGQGVSISEEDEGESSGGDLPVVPTPPDSPHLGHKNSNSSDHDQLNTRCFLDMSKDIYAVESCPENGNRIYFMALVDVLTQYGLRKRTAQAAKSVKHGGGAEISTVHPDQYAKRLCDFVSKSMV